MRKKNTHGATCARKSGTGNGGLTSDLEGWIFLSKLTDKEREIVDSVTERLHTMRTRVLKNFEKTLDAYIAERLKQLEFDLKVGKC